MDDPYEVLGVPRTATAAEIRSAYLGLAKQHHPDVNPGRPGAEARFKTIGAANELLSDPEQRARFDRGEIDASGVEKPSQRRFYRDFGDDVGRAKYRAETGFDIDDLEGIFARAFSSGGGRGNMRGRDDRYALTVDLADVANGAVRRLTLPDGRTLDVTIPVGLRDGQVLRLKGRGRPGSGDAPPGDALIEVAVAPHPLFRRDGGDVVLELPVSLQEAVLGARVTVPTLGGPVSLTIPPGSSAATRLRLKGRGIAGGHQYVELRPTLPPRPEPELAEFLKGWEPRHPFDPRDGMPRP